MYTPENKIQVKAKGHTFLPIDRLLEFQGNLKRLTQQNREKLMASILEKGFIAPIFVWDDAGEYRRREGHQRLKTRLGWRQQGGAIPMLPVDIIEADDEQDAKKKLLAITSQYGEFTTDGYAEFISDIDVEPFTRLVDGEFDIQIREDVDISEQDNEMPKEPADELQDKWQVQLGDVWQCGEHVIACGSSDDESLVSKLLADKKPCICFTDPPYGVSIGDKNKMLNEHNKGGCGVTNIENDNITPEALKELLLGVFSKAKTHCSDECSFFVCSPQNSEQFMMMMREAGLVVRHVLMWKKNCATFSMGRLDYDYAHEPILFTWGKRHKKIMGGSMRSSVWEVNKPKACDLHPTMKPVELYINAYLNNSEEGDYAYEPFSGSGTALLAGEKTKRKVVAIELDPKYVAVALERWSIMTGSEPVKSE